MGGCGSRACADRRRSSYRAMRGDRRPISLSGNCPNKYRHRFSWPAAVLRRTTEQQEGLAMSIKSGAGDASGYRLELVAEAGAHRIDVGIDRGREARIFPFGPHEQTANQIDVDADARRVTIDQVIVFGVAAGQ